MLHSGARECAAEYAGTLRASEEIAPAIHHTPQLPTKSRMKRRWSGGRNRPLARRLSIAGRAPIKSARVFFYVHIEKQGKRVDTRPTDTFKVATVQGGTLMKRFSVWLGYFVFATALGWTSSVVAQNQTATLSPILSSNACRLPSRLAGGFFAAQRPSILCPRNPRRQVAAVGGPDQRSARVQRRDR